MGMFLRPWDVVPLLLITVGMVVTHAAGFTGVTTAFFSLCAVLVSGYVVGRRLLPVQTGAAAGWGALMALATLMLLRGAWFYAGGRLGGWGDVWTTVLLLAVAVGVTVGLGFWRRLPARPVQRDGWEMWRDAAVIFSTLISVAAFVLVAYVSWKLGTTDAIRTPWPLLPRWILPMIGLLWALVLVGVWRTGRGWASGIQAACALGATAVIAPLLYKIGFGFDGFLHVAGETVLATTGTLSPTPPYYMGQYVFVTWLSSLFSLPIAVVDRWLVAAVTMVLIPAAALCGRRSRSLLPALVLIPLAPFVATTPHGFATVLAVAALLSYPQGDDSPMPGVVMAPLFAAWATLTHPLVGLPVLGAIIAALLWRIPHAVRIPLSLLAAIAAGLSVPVVFGLAASFGSAAGVAFDFGPLLQFGAWKDALTSLLPLTPNRYALWAQTSEWMTRLLPWIIVGFTLLGLGRRAVDAIRREQENARIGLPFALASFVTFAAALVMHIAGDFAFLIDYERGNYTERLFGVALLLLLPIAIPTFAWVLDRAKRAAVPSAVGTILIVALLGAGASYAALPRHDAVTASRGWSVSAADIETVRLIDRDAAGEPYTVLANQSVSAAAVREFGFARYHDDVFFYPIPTGGKLYDIFLRASYEDPSRETMVTAADLGGSRLVYLVVNDYWWDADALSERAASAADRTFVVQNGKTKVFKYEIQ